MLAAPPRIGLTTYREKAAWGVWNESADILPATYADSVAAAGGVPMLLPPTRRDEAAVCAALDGVHGLLISGGADVDPARYDAARDPQSGPARADRDEWELALVRAAIAARLPVLAICRGMQVLNVALGGTLHQHLPNVVGSELHCPTTGVHGRHDVRLQSGTLIHGVFGDGVVVATYHHQGVDRLGDGLIATGWAEDDLVEAVELPDEPWVVGVQWHPEVSGGPELFEAFVAAARGEL